MDTEPLSLQQATEWRWPESPTISPDGSRIAFVLRDVAKPDEHGRAAIWMTDREGNTRPFTRGPREDEEPCWSPDGSHLAFVSDRAEAGTSWVYTIPACGGEARPVGQSAGGASRPRWSPDGRWLAFVGKDPETDEDRRRKEERRDEVVADQNLKYGRLYLVPPEGGEVRLLGPREDAHVSGFGWSPDSRQLVALLVRSARADDRYYGPSRLVAFDLDGGMREIVDVPEGVDQPLPSPDGRTIAYRAAEGRIQAHDGIWTVSSTGGAPRLLTRGYPGSIVSIAWAPDSREVLFAAYRDRWGHLGAVDLEGAVRDLVPFQRHGSFHSDLSVAPDGRAVAAVRSSGHEPPDVWIGAPDEQMQRVTDLNRPLRERGFSRAEPVEWRGRDGMTIGGLLFRPPDAGARPLPLILHIHGGPAWLWSDRFMANWHDWAQILVARGYAVLCPNPRGSIGRGAAFTDAEINDMGGGELEDVLRGVDRAIEMGAADPERLGVGGWSHGGYLTAWTITQTDRFRAAVVGAGVSNLVSDQGENDIPRFNDEYFDRSAYEDPQGYLARSPVAYATKVRTPTLILHGERDERVTLPQGQELYRALKRAGVETQFVAYPRERHAIAERAHQIDLMERVIGWFDRHVKGEDR